MLLTVAEYITPKGSVIQSRGLTPDVKLEVHMISRPRVAVYMCSNEPSQAVTEQQRGKVEVHMISRPRVAVYSCACTQMRIDACRPDVYVNLAVSRFWFRLCGFRAEKGTAPASALEFHTHEISHV